MHIRHCVLYEYKLGRKATEATKNICSVQCVRKVRELIEKYFFHIFFLLQLAKYFSLNDTISQNMKSKARPLRENARVQIQTLAKEGITPKRNCKKIKGGSYYRVQMEGQEHCK